MPPALISATPSSLVIVRCDRPVDVIGDVPFVVGENVANAHTLLDAETASLAHVYASQLTNYRLASELASLLTI